MPESTSPLSLHRPAKGRNNVWYHTNESDTVFVFVHGVLSDSHTCWYCEDDLDPSRSEYWPRLVLDDPRFEEPSIFLGGYETEVDSGPYEIRHCAEELLNALRRTDEHGNLPVLDKLNVVFICHSMGGIVVRYMLESNYRDFEEKRVGLVLIASPSYGSKGANRLDLLLKFFHHRQGQQLRWGSWSLKDLDARFKRLVNEKRIPRLQGVEALEHHFIVHNKWLPFWSRRVVVSEESAGRYFGPPRLLPDTDHFSVAKPTKKHHPSHELLVDFWRRFRSAYTISELLRDTAAKGPAAVSAERDDSDSSAARSTPLAFSRVSEYWEADPAAMREGRRVAIEGTVSKYAPLYIGPPKEKRRLHLEFREWMESQEGLDDTVRAQANAYLSYTAGQMVWRLEPPESRWRFLGLYQAIVRNSIPLFVESDYYARVAPELFGLNRLCVDARVTGRLRRLQGQFLYRFVDMAAFEGPLRPVIDERRSVFGLFVDGEGTEIEKVRDTLYLDGDIWIAVRTDEGEKFITRFLDLSDVRAVEREKQELKAVFEKKYPKAEIVFEFDQRRKLFPDYASTTADQILRMVTSGSGHGGEPGR